MLLKTAENSIPEKISGIVLYAKQPGVTSFSSLYTIKHILGTHQVGHTGTLDCFASGLLVVCVGSLTKFSALITAFDKVYEAVIAFGSETDTLDPSGTVIRTAGLPECTCFEETLKRFTGVIMQSPPAFSAIHIDGRRASDLARDGRNVVIPPRPVEIYESRILELQKVDDHIKYARVYFHVSKGTYIRCLARDIASACGSAAHLAGLLRTQVGSFRLSDAAGAQTLAPFTIKNVCAEAENNVPAGSPVSAEEIMKKIQPMTSSLAASCGFLPLYLLPEFESSFYNGKPLYPEMFTAENRPAVGNCNTAKLFAVFTSAGIFSGAVEYSGSYLKYCFVIH
jgi:tRNA pseudouridine55 synthase